MAAQRLRLQTLRPRLSSARSSRIAPIEAPKVGATERIRGRAGFEQRERVLAAHNYLCVRCREQGLLVLAAEVDHRIPLEQGGSNDDPNLDPLCGPHHKAKTAAEARQRAGRPGGVGSP